MAVRLLPEGLPPEGGEAQPSSRMKVFTAKISPPVASATPTRDDLLRRARSPPHRPVPTEHMAIKIRANRTPCAACSAEDPITNNEMAAGSTSQGKRALGFIFRFAGPNSSDSSAATDEGEQAQFRADQAEGHEAREERAQHDAASGLAIRQPCGQTCAHGAQGNPNR